jgi:hypothetical protein
MPTRKPPSTAIKYCISCNTKWRDFNSEYCPDCAPFTEETTTPTSNEVTNDSSSLRTPVTLPELFIPKEKKEPQMTLQEVFPKLREDFAPSLIQTRTDPRRGTMSYLSHATVTDRILSVDPAFTIDFEFKTSDGPIIDRDLAGIPVGAHFILTILGVSKSCYGSFSPALKAEKMAAIIAGTDQWSDTFDPDFKKKMESDALSRGASKFGIGLQLWAKVDLNVDPEEETKQELLDELRKVKMSDADKEAVADYLKEIGKPKIVDLNVTELLAVLNLVKPPKST